MRQYSENKDLPIPGVKPDSEIAGGSAAPEAESETAPKVTPTTRKAAVTGHPFAARIDCDICTGCEVCREFCPLDCITFHPGPEFERIGATCRIDEKACVGCFICQEYCRWDAILRVARTG